MGMAKSNLEIEIKLRVADATQGRRILDDAGFAVSRERVFEANVLYDTQEGRLRQAGSLLRVRKVNNEALLTFKGPGAAGKHKEREELELVLTDAGTFAEILGRLDMHPVFRYEKYRTEFASPDSGGIATLDETPIGTFLELEGPPGWIDETAASLGFSEQDYILESYGRLYVEWCESNRRPLSDMLFGIAAH
jgi:adenylate cyclase class 2